jgi:predicted ArsR family transcriptional regulator
MNQLQLSQNANKVAKMLAASGGVHVNDIARSLNTTKAGARGYVDHLRRKGFGARNLGWGTSQFGLSERPARAAEEPAAFASGPSDA